MKKSILNVLAGLLSFFQVIFIGLTAFCLLSIPSMNWFGGASGDYGDLADNLVLFIFISAVVVNTLQALIHYLQKRNGLPTLSQKASKILWVLILILFVAGTWYPGARYDYKVSLVTGGGFINGICGKPNPVVNRVLVLPASKGAFMHWVCLGEY